MEIEVWKKTAVYAGRRNSRVSHINADFCAVCIRSEKIGFIYYLLIAICFWTAYKTYVIPYFALGAEITQDFNERNTLRTYCGVFIYISSWIASAGPMFIIDKVTAAGGTEKMSWFYSAASFGAIGLMGALICWRGTRGKELILEDEEQGRPNILRNFIELYKIRPFKMIFLTILFYCINFAVASAAFVYLMTNNLGMDAGSQAMYWTLYTVICITYMPVINFMANKMGKKPSFIWLNMIGITGSLVFAVIGIHSYASLIVFTILYNIGNVCFWTIGYSMMYDCCEVDELINGQRREGAIAGFASFSQKLGSAIGLWLSGMVLNFIGYNGDAAEQSGRTLHGINELNTLVPAILLLIALVFITKYPLNAKKFASVINALELKRQGQKYPEEVLEKLKD